MARKKKTDEVIETTETKAPAKTSAKGAKVISYRQGEITLSTGKKVEFKKVVKLDADEMKEFTSLVDSEMFQAV